MVPDSYHAFFSGCVSVAGALIGLLFVAISITPHKMAGDRASTEFQRRAGIAFTSLINALVISLVALLPGDNMGWTSGVVSVGALSSVIGLTILTLRNPEIGARRVWVFVRLVALGLLFAGQFVNSFGYSATGNDTSTVGTQAILTIACFLVSIDRAWELLGGTNAGMLSVFADLARQRRSGGRSDA
jgi:hypothetical protein